MMASKSLIIRQKPEMMLKSICRMAEFIPRPRGRKWGAFLKGIPHLSEAPIMGAVVNGEIRELTHPVNMEARVRPLSMEIPTERESIGDL